MLNRTKILSTVAAAGIMGGVAAAEPVILTFGFTDLIATTPLPGTSGTLVASPNGPLQTSGDVSVEATTEFGAPLFDGTADFDPGTIGSNGTAMNTADAEIIFPFVSMGPSTMQFTVTDVDGDTLVITASLFFPMNPLGALSSIWNIDSITFNSAGSAPENATFDGADGDSLALGGIELDDQSQFPSQLTLINPAGGEGILIQGVVYANAPEIPAPAGVLALGGLGLTTMVRRRKA